MVLGDNANQVGSLGVQVPDSYLTKHIKRQKATGDALLDDDERQTRTGLVETINLLEVFPQFAKDTASYLREKIRLYLDGQKLLGKDAVEHHPLCLSQVEKFWLTGIISKHTSLNGDLILKWAKKDSKAVGRLAAYLLNATLQLKIPEAARRKAVLSGACLLRVNECGGRLKFTHEEMLEIERFPAIPWATIGSYELSVDDGTSRVVSIKNRPTGVDKAVPESDMIDKDYRVEENWSDLGAKLVRGKTHEVKIATYFSSKTSAGAFQVKPISGQSEVFQNHSIAAAAALSRQELEYTTTIVSSSDEFKKIDEGKKKETAAKMREALATRRAEAESNQDLVVNAIGSVAKKVKLNK